MIVFGGFHNSDTGNIYSARIMAQHHHHHNIWNERYNSDRPVYIGQEPFQNVSIYLTSAGSRKNPILSSVLTTFDFALRWSRQRQTIIFYISA